MILPRIIPCLLLKEQGLVKGVGFEQHRYIGDPINTVQLFSSMQADELLLLDIDATIRRQCPNINLVRKIADQCLMPFTIGGGINSVKKAASVLRSGAEKVCLNTEALENPAIIKKISQRFGKQSIMISLDYKKTKNGKYKIYTRCGTKVVSDNIVREAVRIQNFEAGEILLNCIDKDGTLSGYDIDTIKMVTKQVNIPVIACGGAGSATDLKEALARGEADSVSAGSLFVFHGPRKAVLITYPTEEQRRWIGGLE